MKLNYPLSKINYWMDLLTIAISIIGAVYYQINNNQTMLYWMCFSLIYGIASIIYKPMDRIKKNILLFNESLRKRCAIKLNKDMADKFLLDIAGVKNENKYSRKLVGYKSVNLTKYSIKIEN